MTDAEFIPKLANLDLVSKLRMYWGKGELLAAIAKRLEAYDKLEAAAKNM